MRIVFHGTRGSIAKAHPSLIRYGGNTSCVEIRSEANDLLILDAGTGLHQLGDQLLVEPSLPRSASILISHTHWDHIQGLPFFTPFFLPQYHWNIFGPSTLSQDLKTILHGQMQQTYFPITADIFNANISYHTLVEGSFEIGDIKITTRYLNHPGVTLGYRIEVDGYTVVYATDHEPHDCRLAHGGLPIAGSEDALHGDFLAQADYVIHDAQYIAQEYERYRGWGHSTVEYVVDLAHRADVQNLILFHHDPRRTDQELDHILEENRAKLKHRSGKMELIGASERRPLLVSPPQLFVPGTPSAPPGPQAGSAITRELPSTSHHSALCFSRGIPALQAALESAHSHARWTESLSELGALYRAHLPSLVFLQVSTFEQLSDCYQALSSMRESDPPPLLVLICELDECADPKTLEQFSPLPIRLPLPVSAIYLSSRIQSWISRGEGQGWRRAQFPRDERCRAQLAERVLEEFHAREAEAGEKKRIPRLIELAKQLMMLPSKQELTIALNLITLDRQETIASSSVSLEMHCSRDLSMCSHVIEEGARLYAPDVSQHDKLRAYSDFVQSKGDEVIRAYLGFPLRLAGQVVGTLCCLSTHYLQFNQGQQDGLEQIAELLMVELTELLERD